jgi:hypothetical protein
MTIHLQHKRFRMDKTDGKRSSDKLRKESNRRQLLVDNKRKEVLNSSLVAIFELA